MKVSLKRRLGLNIIIMQRYDADKYIMQRYDGGKYQSKSELLLNLLDD